VRGNTARKQRTRAAPAPRLRAVERKEHLLDVARAILLEEGVRALTMERLAERAAVSKGLGYAYFNHTEDVLLSLWDREVGEVYRRIEEATRGAATFEEVAGRAVKAYFDVLSERGALLGSLQAQLTHGRLEKRIANRVRDFVSFWRHQLATFLPLEPRTATAVAAMVPAAADACARVWQAGAISRAAAEALACTFVLGGARAVAQTCSPTRASGLSHSRRRPPLT
jgi:AcrR family transcriptional regulator